MSFLVLWDTGEDSAADDDEDGDEESDEESDDEGDVGADWDVCCGWFSSDSSMWAMAETDDGRRLEQASGEEVQVSPRGWWTEMALRRQLSHCCLWKTSLTCRVCAWA